MLQNPDAIIIGGGPAGLACAMAMRAAGLNAAVLEKADTVGSAWRRHYDRLHLHTDRRHSGLPGMVMPETYPAYPSRAQMVDYLESYAARSAFSQRSTPRFPASAGTARNGARKRRGGNSLRPSS